MPYIGNVQIPFITSQDLSKGRKIVEREYVGSNPTVTEHEALLESGSYSFLLRDPEDVIAEDGDDAGTGWGEGGWGEGYWGGDEPSEEVTINFTVEEQRRGVEALTDRNAAETPARVHGDKGFLSIEKVNFQREPRDHTQYGDMDLRYLEYSEYRPGMLIEPRAVVNDYGVDDKSFVPVPSAMNSVRERSLSTGDRTTPPVRFGVTTEDGKVNSFEVNEQQVVYEFPDRGFMEAVREGEVQLWRGDKRLFGDPHEASDITVTNGAIEWDVGSGDMRYFVESDDEWHDIGSVNFSFSNPFLRTLTTHFANVVDDFGEMVQLRRGAIFLAMDVESRQSVEFDSSVADWPIQSSEEIWDGSTFVGYTNHDDYDFFIMRSRNMGNFSGTQTLRYDNIPDDRAVRVAVGIIPSTDESAKDNFRSWCNTDLNIESTVLDRSVLGGYGEDYGEDYG